MRSVAWYVVGFLTALIVAVIAGVVLLNKTAHGFSANAPPTLLEVWAARKARDLALPNTEKQRTNPILNTPEVLNEARAHWADQDVEHAQSHQTAPANQHRWREAP